MITAEILGYLESSVIFHRLLYKVLEKPKHEILIQWYTEHYPRERFTKLVKLFHDELSKETKKLMPDEAAMQRLCNTMNILYMSNRKNYRVKYTEFYNDTINKNPLFRKVRIIVIS